MQPIGGQSSKYGAAFDVDVISSWTLIGQGTEDTGRFVATAHWDRLKRSEPEKPKEQQREQRETASS
jgi:hypothetical protein